MDARKRFEAMLARQLGHPGGLAGRVVGSTLNRGELVRVLKGSSRAVVGLRDPEEMAKMALTAHGFRLRSVEEVRRALEAAGRSLEGHRRASEGRHTFEVLVAAPPIRSG